MQKRRAGLKLTFPLFMVVALLVALVFTPEKALQRFKSAVAGPTADLDAGRTRSAQSPAREKLRDAVAGIPGIRPMPLRPDALRPRPMPKLPPRRRARRSGAAVDGIFSVGAARRIDPSVRFTVRGEVFDLTNLRPVMNARVSFKDPETGRHRTVRTDSNGVYHTILRANIDGYYVTISRPGYSPRYLRDWIPSLRNQKARQRRDAARQHRRSGFQQDLVFSPSEGILIRDYAMIRK